MLYHQLTQEERYLIAGGRRLLRSQRELAEELGRAPSTISREVRRNVTPHDGGYRGEKAHGYAVASGLAQVRKLEAGTMAEQRMKLPS
ncbi:MAG: helix-turn-helix domain-containing protein [Holophagales bacterium]|nr:helix-turn-helix domain-containing protein [Holophagales bacterium]